VTIKLACLDPSCSSRLQLWKELMVERQALCKPIFYAHYPVVLNDECVPKAKL